MKGQMAPGKTGRETVGLADDESRVMFESTCSYLGKWDLEGDRKARGSENPLWIDPLPPSEKVMFVDPLM